MAVVGAALAGRLDDPRVVIADGPAKALRASIDTPQGTRVLEGGRLVSLGGYALREAWTADDWLTIFDRITSETRTMFFEPIQLGSQAAMTMAAQTLIAELAVDTSFLLTNPRAVVYLQQHGYGLISQIDAVTRGNIATIVNNGVAEGWSYDRVAKEISSLYSEMAVGKPQLHIDSRAHLIAVTESGNAYEAGNSILVADLQDAGLQMEKKWLSVAGLWLALIALVFIYTD